jgi:FkbM family methyltransferase
MPSKARKSLFHFAYNCAPDEFEKFAYLYGNVPSQNLRVIASNGFLPKIVVDVGAYQGQWSRMAKSIWPDCHIIMIEPNLEQREALQCVAGQLNATFCSELLGAENGRQVNFHVMQSGSSILQEHSDVPRRTETRQLRTLNSVLGTHQKVDLLKLDAQGYELQILDGADKILPNVEAAILELSLIEVNDGCPLIHEVISYMHATGFVAYDILEFHRRPLDRALFQIDVFFCREDSQLRKNKNFR